MAVGKEVEGRIGLLIYLKWGWKKNLQLMEQELEDWYVVQSYKFNRSIKMITIKNLGKGKQRKSEDSVS